MQTPNLLIMRLSGDVAGQKKLRKTSVVEAEHQGAIQQVSETCYKGATTPSTNARVTKGGSLVACQLPHTFRPCSLESPSWAGIPVNNQHQKVPNFSRTRTSEPDRWRRPLVCQLDLDFSRGMGVNC